MRGNGHKPNSKKFHLNIRGKKKKIGHKRLQKAAQRDCETYIPGGGHGTEKLALIHCAGLKICLKNREEHWLI